MTSAGDLLPSRSTDEMEYALAAGMSDTLPVDYATLMDPYRTRDDLLDWLAFQHSVDLWFPDWPVARKREAVAQAAGLSVLHSGEIATLKGTRPGAVRYLALVDAELVHAVTYPRPAFIGRFPAGRTLIGAPPFKARYLVKTRVMAPAGGLLVGQSSVGRRALRAGDFTPVRRAIDAVRVAKATETEIRIDFSNHRVLRAGDAVAAGDGYRAGQYLPRRHLGPI